MEMAKEKRFMDFQEEGVYDSWVKTKSIEDAVKDALEAVGKMKARGYIVDLVSVEFEDVDAKDGFHIRVTGDK